MDRLPLSAAAAPPPQLRRVLDAYSKALATAASVAAYTVLARSVARELFPDELRAAVRWAAAAVRARLGQGDGEAQRRCHTLVIRRRHGYYGENHVFDAARTYLAARVDPRAMRRLCLSGTRANEPGHEGRRARATGAWSSMLCMEPGDSTTDVFDGVEFTWTAVRGGGEDGESDRSGGASLELSFDGEHTGTALERYVPFVLAAAEELRRRDRPLRIFMNEAAAWRGISHHHPATFDTLAMDPELKRSIVADLDRFLKRRDYYRRIGKAWKRGYLLYGPPGTGKSSLAAAMANHLRFDLYDLDLSEVHLSNSSLQRLLIGMPNKSILVVEDIDCCFDAAFREDGKVAAAAAGRKTPEPAMHDREASPAPAAQGVTLSGLLNFIDGLWSTTGEERVIVFTTNYRDRLDPALPAGAHGRARAHGLLRLGGVQDAGPELLPRRRARAVPGDTGAAVGGGGDAGRGVGDAAAERGRRRRAPGAHGIPPGEAETDRGQERVN
ncbi:hypothetical protein ACP4OV_029781 [Aristida adscensionis]